MQNKNLEEIAIASGARTFYGWREYCRENKKEMLSAAELYSYAKESGFTISLALKEKKTVLANTFIVYNAQHPSSGTISHISLQKRIKIEVPYILTKLDTIPHLSSLFDVYPCAAYFQALFNTKDANEEILKTLEVLTGKKATAIRFMNSRHEFRRFCDDGVVAFRGYQKSIVIEGDISPYAQGESAIITRSYAP